VLGAAAPRIPADALDQAGLRALYACYATAEPVLAAMIDRANSQHHEVAADRRDELATLAAQVTTAEHAIARYLTALGNGTMDESIAGSRVRDLREQIAQLRARHAQITDEPDSQPIPPPPGTIARIRDYLVEVLLNGTPAERQGRRRSVHRRGQDHQAGGRTRLQDP
jgi:site-specific DNA recombinase